MGFFGEIKKLLFAGKSVGKSAAGKTAEYAREQAAETGERIKDAAESARERTAELLENIEQEAADVWSRLDQKTQSEPTGQERADGQIPNEPGAGSKARESMEEAADAAWQTTQDISEKVGKEVLEKGSELWEKTKQVSEEVGEELLEKGQELFDRGKSYIDKLSEEAENAAREEEALRKDPFGHRSSGQDEEAGATGKDSLLEGMDDFFDRAARFAGGDYHNTGKARPTGKSGHEERSKKKPGKVKGFEDLDGDGDELIDDAIIDNGDEE